MTRKKIARGARVPVAITPRQRVVITEHTLAHRDLTEPLRRAQTKGAKLLASFTLDELIGYIAAEANHTESKQLQGELDALYQYLSTEMESYDDGMWQEEF